MQDDNSSYSGTTQKDSSFENSEGDPGYADLTNILMATTTVLQTKTKAIYDSPDNEVISSPEWNQIWMIYLLASTEEDFEFETWLNTRLMKHSNSHKVIEEFRCRMTD